LQHLLTSPNPQIPQMAANLEVAQTQAENMTRVGTTQLPSDSPSPTWLIFISAWSWFSKVTTETTKLNPNICNCVQQWATSSSSWAAGLSLPARMEESQSDNLPTNCTWSHTARRNSKHHGIYFNDLEGAAISKPRICLDVPVFVLESSINKWVKFKRHRSVQINSYIYIYILWRLILNPQCLLLTDRGAECALASAAPGADPQLGPNPGDPVESCAMRVSCFVLGIVY